jgi:hypothetical protein
MAVNFFVEHLFIQLYLNLAVLSPFPAAHHSAQIDLRHLPIMPVNIHAHLEIAMMWTVVNISNAGNDGIQNNRVVGVLRVVVVGTTATVRTMAKASLNNHQRRHNGL